MHDILPKPIDPALATKRTLGLLCISIAAMACLGSLTMLMVDFPSLQYDALPDIVSLLGFCGLIGGMVGLFVSPIVVGCLHLKQLSLAVPIVYGVALIVLSLYVAFAPQSFLWPLDTAIPAFLSVCVVSGVVAFCLPNRYSLSRGSVCAGCGYDLQGRPGCPCPECGQDARSRDRHVA